MQRTNPDIEIAPIPTNGGYSYRITIPGGDLTGWRRGTPEEVRQHAAKVHASYWVRAHGGVIKKYRNGQRRPTKNGRSITQKQEVDPSFLVDEPEGAM